MILVLFICYLLYLAEIARNYYIIEVEGRRPVYWKSTVYRILAGATLWIFSPFLWPQMRWWQWWGMIPMMVLSFWFFFDYGLNIARNVKPFYYLNPEGSLLDRLQCNYPNAYPWFWWKLFFMMAGVSLFHYGLNAIWER